MNKPLTITRENGTKERIGFPPSLGARLLKWFAGLFVLAVLIAAPAGAQQFNQGGNVGTVQPAGRLYTSSGTTAFAGVTTEALFSFGDCRNFSCAAAATTHAVTSTSTLKINSLCATWMNETAAAGGVTIRCRVNPGSVVVATSTVFATLNASTALTTVGSGATTCVDVGGIELRAPAQWGCSQFSVTTSSGFHFNVFGVEY